MGREIAGKVGEERRVPLHPEAFEQVGVWLDVAQIREEPIGPMFRPAVGAA
jgi:hypothetical protein